MAERRATQKDVARLAGVSQAAVSMVLSGGSPSVSAETWERVTRAAKELGYRPNRFAQALKTNRTMTIACVVPDIANPFYPSLVRGIQSACDALEYDVIVLNTEGAPERERRLLEWARQGRVDGVVGVFFSLRAPDFRPLVEVGVPVVRIESSKKPGGELPIDDMFVDSRAAAFVVTEYLMRRGHRRIGMIAGHGGPQGVRVDGYKAAMAEAALEPHVVLDEAFSEEGGFRAARAILASSYRPTAIFAANDLMAIGAMQALREHGLAIPRDIAVAGFDDIPAARLVTPALTTVAQYQHQMGVKAAQILMQRIGASKQVPGRAFEMPFKLIERYSV